MCFRAFGEPNVGSSAACNVCSGTSFLPWPVCKRKPPLCLFLYFFKRIDIFVRSMRVGFQRLKHSAWLGRVLALSPGQTIPTRCPWHRSVWRVRHGPIAPWCGPDPCLATSPPAWHGSSVQPSFSSSSSPLQPFTAVVGLRVS